MEKWIRDFLITANLGRCLDDHKLCGTKCKQHLKLGGPAAEAFNLKPIKPLNQPVFSCKLFNDWLSSELDLSEPVSGSNWLKWVLIRSSCSLALKWLKPTEKQIHQLGSLLNQVIEFWISILSCVSLIFLQDDAWPAWPTSNSSRWNGKSNDSFEMSSIGAGSRSDEQH